MTPQNHEQHIRHTFDRYCKKILKYAMFDYYRAIKRRSKREVVFSDMSVSELAELSVTDEYFTNEYVFDILGENISIANVELGKALSALPAGRRDIVIMYFFFGMNDREIAEHLNMARRTVAHQRTSTLRKLKSLLEHTDIERL